MDKLQTQCRHDKDALPRTMARRTKGWQKASDALPWKDEKSGSTRRKCHVTRGKSVEEDQETSDKEEGSQGEATHCNANPCQRTLEISIQERERIPRQVRSAEQSRNEITNAVCLTQHILKGNRTKTQK